MALALRTGLTLRQREQMGLTRANIARIMLEMNEAGQLDGQTPESLAAEILTRLIGDKPEAFKDPKIDWDAILAFIEKLIPLILKIIELFTKLSPAMTVTQALWILAGLTEEAVAA